jgi:hypothetical protein
LGFVLIFEGHLALIHRHFARPQVRERVDLVGHQLGNQLDPSKQRHLVLVVQLHVHPQAGLQVDWAVSDYSLRCLGLR